MPTLTVFTPTYNRAYTLHRCYESLLRQTSSDFTWLVVDDGSTDNTSELVHDWIKDGKIDIEYVYKENGGMHTAHNRAYELIKTKLAMCIDSDDYLTDSAVELIVEHWSKYGNNQFAGLVGNDAYSNGNISGDSLPNDVKYDKFRNIHRGYKGDKKYVYRTDVFNKYPPYPVFEGEKFTPLALKYYQVDDNYSLLILNEILCIIEYMSDGSTKNIISQYRKNPRGFIACRKVAMEAEEKMRYIFRESVHYVSSSIMIRNKSFLCESPRKLITFFALPIGLLLYIYLNYTSKSGFDKS